VALYLRFKNENDENIALAKRVTDIFDGNIPLYFLSKYFSILFFLK